MEKSFCDVEMTLSETFFAACTDDTTSEQTSYKQSCARSNTRSDARKTLLSHRKSCPVCNPRILGR
jgi:hypothetical protein